MRHKAVYAIAVIISWIFAVIVLTGIISGHLLSKKDQITWVTIAMIWSGNALIQAVGRKQ